LENSEDRFPDWHKLYEEQEVETMPWFNPHLDADLEQELKERNIQKGSILDLGTGPGTQAMELAKRGLEVTGTDLSLAAISKAKDRYKLPHFIQDDILETQLKETFDYVFDRGCFHVLPPEKRSVYVQNIQKILKPSGLLFLKCFSVREEKMEMGPYRFSEGQIEKIFSPAFKMESFRHSIFKSTLEEDPKAIFVVLIK